MAESGELTLSVGHQACQHTPKSHSQLEKGSNQINLQQFIQFDPLCLSPDWTCFPLTLPSCTTLAGAAQYCGSGAVLWEQCNTVGAAQYCGGNAILWERLQPRILNLKTVPEFARPKKGVEPTAVPLTPKWGPGLKIAARCRSYDSADRNVGAASCRD